MKWVLVLLFVLAGCGVQPMALRRAQSTPMASPVPLSPARVMPATLTPTTAATPQTGGVTAYFDFQNPATAVRLEKGVTYTVLGWSGPEWVHIQVDGGGKVWARAADLGVVVPWGTP